MCDRDKRQKNLMVIFNRSYLKMGDDLGIWRREGSWKSGKMTGNAPFGVWAQPASNERGRGTLDLRENVRVQVYA